MRYADTVRITRRDRLKWVETAHSPRWTGVSRLRRQRTFSRARGWGLSPESDALPELALWSDRDGLQCVYNPVSFPEPRLSAYRRNMCLPPNPGSPAIPMKLPYANGACWSIDCCMPVCPP